MDYRSIVFFMVTMVVLLTVSMVMPFFLFVSLSFWFVWFSNYYESILIKFFKLFLFEISEFGFSFQWWVRIIIFNLSGWFLRFVVRSLSVVSSGFVRFSLTSLAFSSWLSWLVVSVVVSSPSSSSVLSSGFSFLSFSSFLCWLLSYDFNWSFDDSCYCGYRYFDNNLLFNWLRLNSNNNWLNFLWFFDFDFNGWFDFNSYRLLNFSGWVFSHEFCQWSF